MIPKKYKTAIDELRRLIDQSAEPLTTIAEKSGVTYTPLWKWYNEKQKGYSLIDGEKVYYYLSGKTFLGKK